MTLRTRGAGLAATGGRGAPTFATGALGRLNATRSLAAMLMAAGLALMGPLPAGAQGRSIVIEDMHAVYAVRQNGDVEVEERYRVRFNGSWNGLRRLIELGLPDAYGLDDPVGFRLDATTNADGDSRRNEVTGPDRFSREIRVYVPNANDRTASVVIEYTLSDALGFFAADETRELPALDEFYWQVTGTDWEVPIRQVSAEVHVPMSTPVSQAAAYFGGAASQNRAPVTTDGAVAYVDDVGPLRAGEGLTIGVGWPAGAVERDPARVIEHPDQGVADRVAGPRPGPLTYLPLLFPFGVFWMAYRAWDKRGRDPKERAIVVRWDPPEELSPAEAGTLVDHSPEMHDIISTLVELAVKGYVVIEEREKEGFLQFGREYVFHLVRPRSEWDDLLPHQWRFLDGLFKHGSDGVGGILKDALGLGDDASVDAPPETMASVKLSDLKNEFYKEIPGIRDAILDNLVRKGHYMRRPDKARQIWFFGAVFMAAAGFGGFTLTTGGGNTVLGVVLLIATGLSAAVLAVFGAIMPARTEKGARTREAALGFKQFLQKVESPRYKRMITSPDQFEEFLPYAMAFQCQEQWARAFDDLLSEPPDWYHGHHGHFHATAFASDMGRMATTAGSTMASSPGGSGSGGGGSVGGGGGGGGGGGF